MKVSAIIGPTAAGKSEVAVGVAVELGAEIVSVDSMQIYRTMDAGTAKPSLEMQSRVRHHLIDLMEPDHALTVAEYQRLGREAIADISARGRLPLLVGGSGLYFRAIVDDLVFPPRDPAVRLRLQAEAGAAGAEVLYSRLEDMDPEAAAKIEPGNERRVVRALEVIEITGRKFSDFAAAWERFDSRYDLKVAGLTRPRPDLYGRIAARAGEMIAAGLIEETRRLDRSGMSLTARQALGYRQVLDAPKSADKSEVREAIVRATKRFARRQESWFRADPRITWFDASEPNIVNRLVAYFSPSA